MEYDSSKSTLEHKQTIVRYMTEVVKELMDRAVQHDDLKLQEPEKALFDEYTPKLQGSTYGTPEYEEFRTGMKVALDHHYARYRHHPEHFPNGVKDMTLIDLIEMLVDWKAASMRHADGNLLVSIDKNKERFGYPEYLAQIFRNTANQLDQM